MDRPMDPFGPYHPTKPQFLSYLCDLQRTNDFRGDFEAILKRFRSVFYHLGRNFTGKLGVGTAEEVMERFVPSAGQKEVLERSIS